jgi:flavin-dependent dehydrogenase
VQRADAIVVGGGPAGSTCAWKLRQSGLEVIVLDRAEFPRTKLCAGWITPRVLKDLELDPADYPHRFLTFDRLHLHWKFLSVRHASQQHSIRRYEFDDFLLKRSGAAVITHQVRSITKDDGGDFVIDDRFRSRFLVGAGGTSCPVYRTLFRRNMPRNPALQAATLEQEFAYDWRDPACHLWFLRGGLPGYAWYVPKADGYVNVGLGGMAGQLKRSGRSLHDHWRDFTGFLARRGLVEYGDYQPRGYSYYLNGNPAAVSEQNAFLVGDAAGLATQDMCEGIGPAVESALLAADSILTGSVYSLDSVTSMSGQGFVSRHLASRFAAAA